MNKLIVISINYGQNSLSRERSVPVIKSQKKHVLPVFFCVFLSLMVFGSLFPAISDNAHAENLNFSASVAPSLHISIPDSAIELELSPTIDTPDFTTATATINVATNNPTGYNLSLNAEDTNLTRTATYKSGENFLTSTIPTITAAANSANFPLNSWGYKIGNNVGDNYLPFATTNQLRTTTTTTDNDEITLAFAASADLSQQPGTYELSMNVIAVTNYVIESPTTLQNTTLAKCQEFADDAPLTVIDTRDNEAYNIRYINGRCWLVDNLRLAPGTELTSADSNIAAGTTWTVPADSTAYFTYDNVSGTTNNGYNTPGVHIPTAADMTTINNGMTDYSYPTLTAEQVGAWYNYCAATAGTICYGTSDPHAQDEAEYDICPSGWRLPTSIEQLSGTVTEGVTNNANRFAPVAGGYYNNGPLSNIYLYQGNWWSSTAGSAMSRYGQHYDVSSGSLTVSHSTIRNRGYYVRCVKGKPTTTITFNANGGTGEMPNQNIENGTTAGLTANNFTKPGYDFIGWSTVPDGSSGTTYLNSQFFSAPQSENDSTITLYAQWGNPPTIQSFTKSQCEAQASDAPITVIDSRDGNDYAVRYINGNCWMVQNLRLAPSTELTSTNSNIATGITWTVPAGSTVYFSYSNARGTTNNGYNTPGVHVPTEDDMTAINNDMTNNSCPTLTAEQVGAWYNYCAATAETICYASNSTDPGATAEAQYDICPAGWRLPTRTEQGTVTGTATIGGTNNASRFAPVAGGYYASGLLSILSGGFWWSSTAGSATDRYSQYYLVSSGSLGSVASGSNRFYGFYVRCVRSS